ncbi:MAG: hypothetical protein FJ109_19850 [Deltaproteobacteria bacterium]|nr:hypothetical protein [Deltaproteobacteria bacterium]
MPRPFHFLCCCLFAYSGCASTSSPGTVDLPRTPEATTGDGEETGTPPEPQCQERPPASDAW